jgi:hypothetical protein
MTSDEIVGWPTNVHEYSPGGSVSGDFNDAIQAIDPASGRTNVVSWGPGGPIVLTFAAPIINGPSWDLAVFKSGFLAGSPSILFGELAFVEVSSDGEHFARFPNQSITLNPRAPFDTIDPGHIRGLAEKWPGGQGTAFDLEDISDVAVDVNDILFVRIVDIIGDGREVDSVTGNPIFDPFSTADFPGPGFDLDAVAALHQGVTAVPISAAGGLFAMAVLGLGLVRGRRSAPTV